MFTKNKTMKIYTAIISLLIAGAFTVTAQEKDMKYDKLETMQDKIETDLVEVYEIVGDYPDFAYEYVYHDGHLDKVMVTGIDNPADKKEVSALIYSVRSAKDGMRNYCNRVGIYYAPEREAEPKVGYDEFRERIQKNLQYPDKSRRVIVRSSIFSTSPPVPLIMATSPVRI